MNWRIWKEPKVYAVRHKDEAIRAASRSGGIFTAISDDILDNGGVIYGCALTDDFQAVHIRVEDKNGRDAMRGSKYIQSKIGDTYKKVRADLEVGRRVLFSGTSCQVAGLKRFLGKEYEKLLCVDIVCHGVPSTAVWKAYLNWQENRAKAKVMAVNFRNKEDFGWRDHVETLTMDNNKQVHSRVFKELFYGHHVLRQCCYECPFKSIMHPGDITIADYWGIEKASPELDDNKGVSLVLVNNDKGEKVFEKIKEELIYRRTRIEDSMQPPLKAPFPKPENREQFWTDFRSKDFGYIARKYGGYSVFIRTKRLMRKVKKKLLRS